MEDILDIFKEIINLNQKEGVSGSKSFGTAFSIDTSGTLITNYHVVKNCNKIIAKNARGSFEAKLVTEDKTADLAVLESAGVKGELKLVLSAPYLMQEVYVAGYPFGSHLSKSIKITRGIVSSLSGIGNNISQIQIDAAVQPGNSGGPIYTQDGEVIGVVVSKLDAIKTLKGFGSIPEGTAFGVKANLVANLLDFKGLKRENYISIKKIQRSDLAKIVSDSTYLIECYK